jgi:hypothetical protein
MKTEIRVQDTSAGIPQFVINVHIHSFTPQGYNTGSTKNKTHAIFESPIFYRISDTLITFTVMNIINRFLICFQVVSKQARIKKRVKYNINEYGNKRITPTTKVNSNFPYPYTNIHMSAVMGIQTLFQKEVLESNFHTDELNSETYVTRQDDVQ